VEHTLQGVDTVPVGVSSVHAQSSPLVQFAVSAMETLARSRNHPAKHDVDLMNVLQNASMAVLLMLSLPDSCFPDSSTTTTH